MKGASELSLCATTIQGARDIDRALSAARIIRDFCEADKTRVVRFFVCSGLPLSQTPLSTIDREIIDTLTRFEEAGRLEVFLTPRGKLESAPRISIRKGDECSEFYANNFDQPISDDLIGAPMYLMTVPFSDAWVSRDGEQARKIPKPLSAIAPNTKAFRHEAGHPRDFKAMFSNISGQSVRIQIEDPYLAGSDRNRGALVSFLQKLRELDVEIKSLTLAWRPVRPGQTTGYADENLEDQQRNLSEALRKIGMGAGIVHLRPRTSRLSHFHDRVITAKLDAEGSPETTFRWDITSGIDNLMQRNRQCSVFLSSVDTE